MACQGILPVQPIVIEMPLHACGRAGVIGVLRLRSDRLRSTEVLILYALSSTVVC